MGAVRDRDEPGLAFSFPVPHSKKNSRPIHRNRKTGRRFIGVAPEVKREQAFMRNVAMLKVERTPQWPTEDVRVEVDYCFVSQRVDVRIIPIGKSKKIKGRTGRDRDLSNIGEAIFDALQTAVYKDDNQIAELVVRRKAE